MTDTLEPIDWTKFIEHLKQRERALLVQRDEEHRAVMATEARLDEVRDLLGKTEQRTKQRKKKPDAPSLPLDQGKPEADSVIEPWRRGEDLEMRKGLEQTA